MSDPVRYAYDLASYDPAQLTAQIAALGLSGFLGVCGSGTTAEALFADALSAADKAALDALAAAYVIDVTLPAQRLRAAADALLSDPSPAARALRAIALAALAEINTLREANNALWSRLSAQDGAVRAATNLGTLQSQWAAVTLAQPQPPAMPDRTKAQLLAVAQTQIDNGTAD